MLIPNLLLLLGATTALALPAQAEQLRLGKAGQAALNFGAGALSKIGSGPVEANTIWSWTNCGKLGSRSVPNREWPGADSDGIAGEVGDAITIKSVKLSPDPPKPGEQLTIYAEGTVNNLVDVSTAPA